MKSGIGRYRAETNQSSFEWLLRLRWLAICGQAFTLAVASGWLHLPLSLPPLISLFIFTAFTNVALGHLPESLRQNSGTLTIILVADVFLLTLLLAFSGGPENPFSILYLLHVVLSAVLLDRKWALSIATLSIGLFALLFVWAVPVQSMHHEASPGVFNTHLLGMWVAYSLVALISAYCITKISAELRRKERETERLTLSQKQLASLTTLAAGAAHELSTPLGTVAIVVGELEAALMRIPNAAPLLDDVQLVKSQLERCKGIISKMSGNSGEIAGERLTAISLSIFARNLESSLQKQFGKNIHVESVEDSPGCVLPTNALVQAVTALTKNAIEASKGSVGVKIQVEASNGRCSFRVIDDGCGMGEEILNRIGEPFFTTKEAGTGMGLGVFLARLTAESLGGSLTFSSTMGRGTEAEMTLPMKELYGVR